MNILHVMLAALLFGAIGCDTNRDLVPAGGAAPPAGGAAPAPTTDPAAIPPDPATANGDITPTTAP